MKLWFNQSIQLAIHIVVLERHLNFSSFVNNIFKSATLSIRNIGNQSYTERLVHAFVTSKLDNWNALLYGLPSPQVEKIQRIQNSATRLVTNTKKFDQISPVLQDLHRLTITNRDYLQNTSFGI